MAISGGRTLMVYLAADTANFRRNMNQADNTAQTFGTRMGSIGSSLTSMLGPALLGAGIAAGAMAAKFAVDGVQAFMADEAAAAKLATTLGNLGLDTATGEVETMIDAQQRLTGVADDELRPAFDRLIRSTKDVGDATAALILAQDIAAGTGKDLKTVTDALGKAYDGNFGALGKLGIGIDAAVLRQGDMDAITKTLSTTFEGQAATAAGTYQGQVKRLGIAFGELQESFGRGFITALGDTENKTGDLMTAMKDLEPAIQDVGAAIGNSLTGLVKAAVAVSNFQKAWEDLAQNDDLWGNTLEALGTTIYNTVIGPLGLALDLMAQLQGETVASTIGGTGVGAGGGGGGGGSFGGAKPLSTSRENDPSVIRANNAARWAAVLDDLKPKLEATTRASGGTSAATETIREAMAAARKEVNDAFKPALDSARTALTEIRDAAAGYAESLKNAITGTVSLSAAWSTAEANAKPGEAFAAGALTAFQKQIGDATGFATAIGALAADPTVSKTLIDQLVQVASSQGPIAGTALANEIISSGLAPALSTQLQALDIFAAQTGAAVSAKFYDQGVTSAVDLLQGISDEIEKQQKALKRLGKNIGEPVGNQITDEISAAIDRGIARGKKAAADAEAAEFTRQTATRATPTAIGQSITAILQQTDQRTGASTAKALR